MFTARNLLWLAAVGLWPAVTLRGQVTPPLSIVQTAQTARPADSTLILNWYQPPRISKTQPGLLDDAVFTVLHLDGTPAASLPLRIVIGTLKAQSYDSLMAVRILTTDLAGRAVLSNMQITGEPRVVYLTVELLNGGWVSAPYALTVGPAVADSISIEQPPSDTIRNGTRLGNPRVRVFAQSQPLANAVVAVVRTTGEATLSGDETRSDKNGYASFPELRATSSCVAQTCRPIAIQFVSSPVHTRSFNVALQLPVLSRLVVMPGAPTEVASGASLPGFTVRAFSADDVQVPGVTITLQTLDGSPLRVATTAENGAALFDGVRIRAAAGSFNLVLTAGAERVVMPLAVRTGAPAYLSILGQPPTRVAFDSALNPHPRVRVTDAGGNPVIGAQVRVRVCVRALIPAREARLHVNKAAERASHSARWECNNLNDLRASLGGTTVRQSGINGEIDFDDLRYRGVKTECQLQFDLLDGLAESTISSSPFTHDPQSDYDNNIVAISAIKTISGVAPESEFFDLRFRFRLPFQMHVMANVDVALTARTDPDNASSPQSRLTEASLLLNSPSLFTFKPESDVPERLVSAGLQFKVFATVPFYGAHIVSMELGGSPFQGSSLAVSFLRKWYSDATVILNGDTISLARHNIGVDFLVRSGTVDFFKVITIRGSLLLPLDRKNKIASRIALAVPIGSVIRF